MKAFCPNCGVDFEHNDPRYLPGYCPECHDKLNRSIRDRLIDAVPFFRAIVEQVRAVGRRTE